MCAGNPRVLALRTVLCKHGQVAAVTQTVFPPWEDGAHGATCLPGCCCCTPDACDQVADYVYHLVFNVMLTKTIRGDCYDIIEIRFRQKLHLKLQSIMVCVRMRVRVCKYTYAVHMRKPEMDIGYLPQSLFTLASFFFKVFVP